MQYRAGLQGKRWTVRVERNHRNGTLKLKGPVLEHPAISKYRLYHQDVIGHFDVGIMLGSERYLRVISYKIVTIEKKTKTLIRGPSEPSKIRILLIL